MLLFLIFILEITNGRKGEGESSIDLSFLSSLQILWLYPVYGLSLLFSSLWWQDIADHAFILRGKHTNNRQRNKSNEFSIQRSDREKQPREGRLNQWIGSVSICLSSSISSPFLLTYLLPLLFASFVPFCNRRTKAAFTFSVACCLFFPASFV